MLSILYLNCWDLWGSLFPVRWSSPQDQPPPDLVALTQPILKTAAAKKRILNVFNWHLAANIQSGFPKMNKIPRWVTIAKVQQLPMKHFKLHWIEAKRVFYLSLMDLKVLPEDLTMLPAFLAAFQFLAGPLSSENWEDDREEVRFLARLLPRALQVERWVCLWEVFRRNQPVFCQDPLSSVCRETTRTVRGRIRVRIRRFWVAEKTSSRNILVVRLASGGGLAVALLASGIRYNSKRLMEI